MGKLVLRSALVCVGVIVGIANQAAAGTRSGVSFAHVQDPVLKPQIVEKAERFLRDEQAHSGPRATAMSIGVSRNGETIFGAGFGEARPHMPATFETPYRVGSITKQFTAVAILDLVQTSALGPDGSALSLDTPISAILPELKTWDDEARPHVALRHLLTMTANVPNFTRRPPPGLSPWRDVDDGTLLHAISAYSPNGPPVEFEYSNTCYFLLAEIADRIMRPQGSSYYAAVETRVVTRAGLAATRFGSLPANAALPTYGRRPAFAGGVWLKGSADLVSTAKDLLAWNGALVAGRAFGAGLSQLLFSEAARVDVRTWYGMGWFKTEKDGVTFFSHSGAVPGYTAYSLIVRREGGAWVSAVVLVNGDDVEEIDTLAEEIALAALDADARAEQRH